MHTIKSATKLIYWELGASSRNEAVTHARELGLLEGWLVFHPHRVMALAPACGGLARDGVRSRMDQVARVQDACAGCGLRGGS